MFDSFSSFFFRVLRETPPTRPYSPKDTVSHNLAVNLICINLKLLETQPAPKESRAFSGTSVEINFLE